MTTRSIRSCCLRPASLAAAPALAADVTPERLANPDKEPQNWLMNHRTYDCAALFAARRASTRTTSRTSSSPMRSRSAAPRSTRTCRRRRWSRTASCTSSTCGASSTRSTCAPATPAASSGAWTPSRRSFPLSNRGAALWGNLVISAANYPARVIATDKETGKVVWETNVSDGQADVQLTAAPLAVKDKIIVGAAGGDRGVRDWIAGARCQDRQAALAEIRDPGAGRARQRDLEGQGPERLADRRRRHVGDRQLRRRHQPGDLGHRQSGADVRCRLSARATISTPTA